MKTKVIKTKSEYAAALARAEKLMDGRPNSPEGDELELLALLIHDYEEEYSPSPSRIQWRQSVSEWRSRALRTRIWRRFWEVGAAFQRFSPGVEISALR
jgi:hypothetical protein